ncbi:hypothetical protein Hdeb2414_s0448g00895931 [Helianthus debilis subsp. tardiflorus]
MFNSWTYSGRFVTTQISILLQFDAISPLIAQSSMECRLMTSKPSMAHNGPSQAYT